MATKTLDLPTMIERYGTEEKCRAYMEDLRWPDGVRVPALRKNSQSPGSRSGSTSNAMQLMPLPVLGDRRDGLSRLAPASVEVVPAIYMTVRIQEGNQRKAVGENAWRELQDGLGPRRTASAHAMEEDSPVPLRGIVEVDETYMGGERRGGKGQGRPWTRD